MRRKLIAMLLIVMCIPFGMASCGSNSTQQADGGEFDKTAARKQQLDEVGMTLYLPMDFIETKGAIELNGSGSVLGDGIYFVSCNYYGVAKDWLTELMESKEVSDEDRQKYIDSKVPLFTLVGIDQDRGAEELAAAVNKLMGEDAVKASELAEIHKNNDITYFKANTDYTDNTDNLEPDYAEEYNKLLGMVDTVIANAEYFKPIGAFDDVVGKTVSFETKDLDGNVVTSEELFSKYDVTMVNVWATWCQWCIKELPELEKMNNELSRKKCAIVGLLGDGDSEETIALAKKQLEEAGCTYLCLQPFDGWEDIFPMNSGWPTSFFFNSKGEMVVNPVVGASLDQYQARFDSILSGSESAAAAVVNASSNDEKAYRIYVVDQDSKPVEGAKVQFCTDDTCKIGTTDDTGAAVFNDPEGVYQVHVLKAPDGYKANDTVLATPDKYSDMTIVLEKE